MNSRVKCKTLTQQEFYEWSEQAQNERKIDLKERGICRKSEELKVFYSP